MSSGLIPTAQVVRQLRRMLSTELFQSHMQQAGFFDYLVRMGLREHATGVPVVIEEATIRKDLYPSPPYKKDSNLIRRNKKLARELLDEYYKTIGQYDPLIFSFPELQKSQDGKPVKHPKGQAYRVEIRRNPRFVTAQGMKVVNYHLRQRSPRSLMLALDALIEPNTIEVGNHDLTIAFAEIFLTRSLHHTTDGSPGYCLAFAKGLLFKVGKPFPAEIAELAGVPKEILNDFVFDKGTPESRKPYPPRYHLIAAAIAMCEGDFKKMTDCIGKACEAGPAEVMESGWVTIAGLIAVAAGSSDDDALEDLRFRSEEQTDDAFSQSSYAFGLYLIRRFDEARNVSSKAVRLDRNCWFSRLTACLLSIASGDGDGALEHYRRMLMVLDYRPYEYLSGVGLLAARMSSLTEAEFREELMQVGRLSQEESFRSDPLQTSLFCMAVGETDRAIAHLEKAFANKNPLLWFLPLWPIFDPLRDDPRFQKLVDRIRNIFDSGF